MVAAGGYFLYFNGSIGEIASFDSDISTKRGSGLVTQSSLLAVLTFASTVAVVVMTWAIWKLLKTVEKLRDRIDDSLREFEMTAEDLRKTNAKVQGILTHAEKSAQNVEHVTDGVRKLRKTLDAATGVLDFAVLPVLGSVAGVLAGSKVGMSHIVNRIFGKEGRHGGR